MIEEALLEHLATFDIETDLVEVSTVRTTRYTLDAPANALRQQVRATYNDEKRLNHRIDRLTTLIADGNSSPALMEKLAEFESQLPWLREKRDALRSRLSEVDSPTAVLRRNHFVDAVTKAPLDRQAANLAARRWLKMVVIDQDNSTVTLHTKTGSQERFKFRIPPSPTEKTRARVRSAPRAADGRFGKVDNRRSTPPIRQQAS